MGVIAQTETNTHEEIQPYQSPDELRDRVASFIATGRPLLEAYARAYQADCFVKEFRSPGGEHLTLNDLDDPYGVDSDHPDAHAYRGVTFVGSMEVVNFIVFRIELLHDQVINPSFELPFQDCVALHLQIGEGESRAERVLDGLRKFQATDNGDFVVPEGYNELQIIRSYAGASF